MYGEFIGASIGVKCLEMVAYHTIHWSCDSVIIVSCMHAGQGRSVPYARTQVLPHRFDNLKKKSIKKKSFFL